MAEHENHSAKEAELATQQRRQFLEKFGKLAMVTPIALTALMSPQTSAAPKSCKPGTGGKNCR